MEERQKRMKKTSNEQFHYMINFLGEHKVMLKGKLSPAESTKVGQLWIQLTNELNNLKGSVKPLQQWKRTFIEYKSKVKAKSRVIQNKLKGTGGGPAEAQLNETENLCLNSIGRITTEGDPEIEEIGLTNEAPSTVVGDSVGSNASKFEEVADAELIDMEIITDTVSIQILKEVPIQNDVCTPTSKKSYNKTTTTPTPRASTLKELADTNEKICQSLASISSAISEMSKSNDAIAASNSDLAKSNNNLASSIHSLACAIQIILAQQKLE